MKLNDAILGALLLLLSLAVLFAVRNFPTIPGQNVGPAAFPTLLAVLLAGSAIALIVRGWRERSAGTWVQFGSWLKSPQHVTNFLVTVGMLVFYIFAADWLGFILTGMVILCTIFYTLKVKRSLIVPIALVATLLIHTIFYKGLRVPLPWGLLQPIAW